MRLYDLADIMRSKNAGPHLITIDVMFRNSRDVDRVLSSAEFTPRAIGRCFNLNEEDIQIYTHRSACAIKVTLPRVRASAGSFSDRDVYGAQQYIPLAGQEV